MEPLVGTVMAQLKPAPLSSKVVQSQAFGNWVPLIRDQLFA